ncbi:MAG: DUF2589 domain-containing protein [Ruminiclostridium sp.]|nr:DUF2589 domain-containing protein [Ruminiclostridium sp.]
MDAAKEFAGLPLGQLICAPIIEVAKGQAALCNVYLEYLFKLAYKNGKDGEINSITFQLNRPIVSDNGDAKLQQIQVEAPLLSLVPVPAFIMDDTTVRFTMEVKEQETQTNTIGTETGFGSSFSYWGFSANISGKVTTNSENTRTTDHSAKYEIYARARQQEPAEGMSKLTSIFASVIEPVSAKSG